DREDETAALGFFELDIAGFEVVGGFGTLDRRLGLGRRSGRRRLRGSADDGGCGRRRSPGLRRFGWRIGDGDRGPVIDAEQEQRGAGDEHTDADEGDNEHHRGAGRGGRRNRNRARWQSGGRGSGAELSGLSTMRTVYDG